MTWEFKPGMKVVCVYSDFKFFNQEIVPKEGQVYTIRNFTHWDGRLGIRLEEIVNKEQKYSISTGLVVTECSFLVKRFRPLQSKGIDLLNSIVAGVNSGRLVVEDEKYMTRFRKSQKKEKA
jgi:hypothetical protein